MKKIFFLLLALALLTGCAAPAPAEPEPLPDEPPAVEETASLPEPRRLKPISAPAVVTEGREPAEDYDLPPLPRDTDWTTYRINADHWVTDGPNIAVLAEDREADAVFLRPAPVRQYLSGNRPYPLGRQFSGVRLDTLPRSQHDPSSNKGP